MPLVLIALIREFHASRLSTDRNWQTKSRFFVYTRQLPVRSASACCFGDASCPANGNWTFMTACLGYLFFGSVLPPELNVFPLDESTGYPNIPLRTNVEVEKTLAPGT